MFMFNRRFMVGEDGFETDGLGDMSKIEKESLCYRLLVERDKINEKLRVVQESLKKE